MSADKSLNELRLALADGDASGFVRRAYRQIADREADPGGLANYRDRLGDGTLDPGAMISIFRDSDEGRRAFRPAREGEAMAHLAFGAAASIVAPLLHTRTRDHAAAMWEAIVTMGDRWAAFPAVAEAEALFGPVIGWIDGLRDGAISGWVLDDNVPIARVAFNGIEVGAVPCNVFRPDLAEAGFANAARGFRFPVTHRDISGGDVTQVQVRVGDGLVPPTSKVVSPWLENRRVVAERSNVRNFAILQVAAFKA